MSSNARKIPTEVLSHPAVLTLIDEATASGSFSPDQVRRASDEAGVEPRHLKSLLAHLSSLGLSVALPVEARVAAATGTRKTTTATAKKAPAKKAAAAEPEAAPAKKAAAKKAPVKKAPAKKAAAPALGPDGKKVLPDVPDEQFEKDVAADPTIKADEEEATATSSFVVSAADDTDEPAQQVMVAGATADPVKDYLKQIDRKSVV